jgi:hypothetical protein
MVDENAIPQYKQLVLMSANVNALGPADMSDPANVPAVRGKRLDLSLQFNQAGADIVGIQETRCTGLSPQWADPYIVVSAPAIQVGRQGVEWWIHKRLSPLPSVVFTLHADPRRLIVKLTVGLPLCHYAPDLGSPDKLQWWDHTDHPCIFGSHEFLVLSWRMQVPD